VTALDAPTQPRSARSGVRRGPAPPPRRARVAQPVTVRLDERAQAPTQAPSRTPTRALSHPPSPPEAPRPARRRRLPWLVGALAAGLATGAGVAAAGISVTPAAARGPSAAQVVRLVHTLGTVSSQPQQLTSTFTVDTGLGLPGTNNAATYRAVGTAYATIDLTQIGTSDVHLTSAGARITIPAAQVTTPVLDPTRSKVVGRDASFVNRLLNDEVSTADLQDQATSHLGDEAQAQGLPAQAQFIAGATVRAALRHLGITNATVTPGS
jgi:hypothetical protein